MAATIILPGGRRTRSARTDETALPVSPSTRAVGYGSAVLATFFSLVYVVAQLAEWIGWLGSAGGPESGSTPLGLVVLLTVPVDRLVGFEIPPVAAAFAARLPRARTPTARHCGDDDGDVGGRQDDHADKA